jgi:hypothetical protein
MDGLDKYKPRAQAGVRNVLEQYGNNVSAQERVAELLSYPVMRQVNDRFNGVALEAIVYDIGVTALHADALTTYTTICRHLRSSYSDRQQLALHYWLAQ